MDTDAGLKQYTLIKLNKAVKRLLANGGELYLVLETEPIAGFDTASERHWIEEAQCTENLMRMTCKAMLMSHDKRLECDPHVTFDHVESGIGVKENCSSSRETFEFVRMMFETLKDTTYAFDGETAK